MAFPTGPGFPVGPECRCPIWQFSRARRTTVVTEAANPSAIGKTAYNGESRVYFRLLQGCLILADQNPQQIHADALVEKAKQGDQLALAELFESHRPRLARMVGLRMSAQVRTRVAISDVLQEAYVDLAQQLDNYAKDPKVPFFLWLRRITGQRLSKLHRAHLGQQMRNINRERRLDAAMPNASSIYMANQLAGEFTSVSERAIRNEDELRLQRAIEQLSETDREVLAMRHVEQLSNNEIALLLEINPSAATNRYVRAIRKLRDALGKS